MKELIVKPTGAFLLVDMHTRQVIQGETKVQATPFVLERIGTGELEVVEAKAKGKAKPKPEAE